MRTIYVAVDIYNGIGRDGKIPWKHAGDMQWFKQKTTNTQCIMGRKTWDSLSIKPLPNRTNIVVTRKELPQGPNLLGVATYSDGAIWFKPESDTHLLTFFKNNPPALPISIIGGAELYKFCLDNKLVDEIWISKIQVDGQCDTFFPTIPAGFIKWEEQSERFCKRERYIWYNL